MTQNIPVIPLLLVLSSCIYSLFALFCVIEFFRPEKRDIKDIPASPISILKPLSGKDPELYENIQSFCSQNYPEYEVLLGVTDRNDDALAVAGKIQGRSSVRIAVSERRLGTNRKVSNLNGLVEAARYPLLAVSDSDMRVDGHYLKHIAGEYFSGKNTGLVTSFYKISNPESAGAVFESLTIALDLIPSVLVARRLEGVTFGLGASMLFSREALNAIGGLEAIADYLADDYQIGNRIWRKGYKIILSRYVLEDKAGAMSIAGHLKHQIRWARTYRACRPKGFIGYGITYVFPISCLLFILHGPDILSVTALCAAVGLRLCLALVVCKKVICSKKWLRWLILLPVKDMLGFGIWIWSLLGSKVVWRGSRYLILKGGKIRKMP
ncbi:MAG TPA: bacteriohopanetetrol glucosamine biosynthesis glycosyltransferase HpnI [Dissulfurispiraceae bacterium]|nr:bacteriohopanetetrol glucosamine biosynthesis glycosyltransferase HpnI [Dissulfurispiraceae bacterium]